MEVNSEIIRSDPRLEFMGLYVQRRLKLKPEKWTRLTTTEEHKTTLKDFLDGSDDQIQLIVVLTPSAQLLPLVNFPLTQLKTKGIYFIKKRPAPIPKEKCSEFLVYGDLATKAIDQLSCLVDEVFVPLLSNEVNFEDWPEIVAQDVQKQVHNLKSTVYQVKGQVNGETILVMPVGVDKIVKVAAEMQETNKCIIDLYLKGAIEGVVIKWVLQVNDVYTEIPSQAFNGGQNPLPHI
ncbi:dynein beta chain, ciliary-like, partial [Contarinia nasturtii]|uniref:dynein beta chain, ciliary-like n=1 Tax=Contarinia nasturtii TaxID=265458 RepID=UPI0012D38D1B